MANKEEHNKTKIDDFSVKSEASLPIEDNQLAPTYKVGC